MVVNGGCLVVNTGHLVVNTGLGCKWGITTLDRVRVIVGPKKCNMQEKRSQLQDRFLLQEKIRCDLQEYVVTCRSFAENFCKLL